MQACATLPEDRCAHCTTQLEVGSCPIGCPPVELRPPIRPELGRGPVRDRHIGGRRGELLVVEGRRGLVYWRCPMVGLTWTPLELLEPLR